MTIKKLIEMLQLVENDSLDIKIRESDWTIHEINPRLGLMIQSNHSQLVIIECLECKD